MPRSNQDRERRQTTAFWLTVLLICAIAGVLSYQAGKNWVGRRLAEVDLEGEARPEPTGESPTTEMLSGEQEEQAPLRPVVEIEEREPTGSERLLGQPGQEGEQIAEGPQDGAELHATESEAEEGGAKQPPTGDGEWVVTAGSFAEEDNARRQVQKLEERGYNPFITEIQKEGITYHRVNVGTFSGRDDAEELAQQVREDGFVAGVVHR